MAVYALGLSTSEKQSKIKIQDIGFYISQSYVTSICVISYVIQIASQSKYVTTDMLYQPIILT